MYADMSISRLFVNLLCLRVMDEAGPSAKDVASGGTQLLDQGFVPELLRGLPLEEGETVSGYLENLTSIAEGYVGQGKPDPEDVSLILGGLLERDFLLNLCGTSKEKLWEILMAMHFSERGGEQAGACRVSAP